MFHLERESIAEKFLNNEFHEIYKATSRNFQNLISYEQFVELAEKFNIDVQRYELAFQNNFQNLQHYIWLDNQMQKAIIVAFDNDSIIQGLYLKPYVTYR